MGITFVEDRIFRKSNDYVSYIHGYYYVDIVTSSFLNDYTVKRLHDTHVCSISHQKFCFYYLPTRGRVGIKLGDADTSPTYL